MWIFFLATLTPLWCCVLFLSKEFHFCVSNVEFFFVRADGKFGTQAELITKRLWALTVNGPLLAVSFLLFWFVWSFPGLQFAVVLCLYDGFLTAVDLHHTALLADLALSAKDRYGHWHLELYINAPSYSGYDLAIRGLIRREEKDPNSTALLSSPFLSVYSTSIFCSEHSCFRGKICLQ